MEDVHSTHKQHALGWLGAVISAATHITRRSGAQSRGLVVTPWSGRSPGGWSA